ncbi:thiamine diphosphate-binding protein [Hyaloraphidium curvatum]|nr:thiamine diphosphate-binding protein [Hyaloraphidium curvatum]
MTGPHSHLSPLPHLPHPNTMPVALEETGTFPRIEPHPIAENQVTVGRYLAYRLEEAGVKEFFGVPGDYNFGILDELQKGKRLRYIGCANELQAGYAADGLSRSISSAPGQTRPPLGVVVVTFTVGALGMCNAVAGAFAEDVALLVVSGSVNTGEFGSGRVAHHTTGLEGRYDLAIETMKGMTCWTGRIKTPTNAVSMIDQAISEAILCRKPSYIEIPTNLALQPLPTGLASPFPLLHPIYETPPTSLLDAAASAFTAVWNASSSPVVLIGPKTRRFSALTAVHAFLPKLGCAVAIQPHAKGCVPENPGWRFAGTYWGPCSSSAELARIVEASDLVVCVGGQWSDYSTAGFQTKLKEDRVLDVGPERVRLPDGREARIAMPALLSALLDAQLHQKPASWDAFAGSGARAHEPNSETSRGEAPLTRKEIVDALQHRLRPGSALVLEIGNSQFDGAMLRLQDVEAEMQFQYGAIGYATPAALGFALGDPTREVVLLVGDGALQVTAQAISTMIASGADVLIVLENNSGNTIEASFREVLHKGSYNSIPSWDYAALPALFGGGRGYLADTPESLEKSFDEAFAGKGVRLVECRIGRQDAGKGLEKWCVLRSFRRIRVTYWRRDPRARGKLVGEWTTRRFVPSP